jgi:hypothetical protein
MAHDGLPPPPYDRAVARRPSPRQLSILAAAFELATAEGSCQVEQPECVDG